MGNINPEVSSKVMTLFTDNDHTYMGYARYAEPHFSILNRSGRSESAEIREILEAWFLRYPDEEKGEFLRRFQSDNDMNFSSSFFELYLHEMVQQLKTARSGVHKI